MRVYCFVAEAFADFRARGVLKHWQYEVLDDFGGELGRYLF